MRAERLLTLSWPDARQTAGLEIIAVKTYIFFAVLFFRSKWVCNDVPAEL